MRVVCPILLLLVVACSGASDGDVEEGSCSEEYVGLERSLDFLRVGSDLPELNKSLSGRLRLAKRVPCSEADDYLKGKEPVILEGCCWATYRPGEDGAKKLDCLDKDAYPPVDSLNWTHASFLELCGDEDVEMAIGARTMAFLRSLPEEAVGPWNESLLHDFNMSLDELIELYSRPSTFKTYHAARHDHEVRSLPHHLAGYLLPLNLKALRVDWCEKSLQQIQNMNFPMLNIFRLSPGGEKLSDLATRKRYWDRRASLYLAGRRSFSHPTHLHSEREVIVSALMEGKKVWQWVEASRETHRALQPYRGGKTENAWDVGYFRVPVDLAESFPVFVGEQRAGDVVFMPRNQIHIVYNLEDSVALNFAGAAARREAKKPT